MKWPKQLTLVRHAESLYNSGKQALLDLPLYQQFREAYADDWFSPRTRRLALELITQMGHYTGEHDVALSPGAEAQAVEAGRRLSRFIDLPDVVYVSPYLRTKATLAAMQQGWPELARVRVIEEERIREQEFGLRTLYGDWRILQVMHPEQKFLHDKLGPYWYRQPQGENIPDVRARCRSWMNTVTRDFAEQQILAITHHLSILAFRANMERLSAEEFLRLNRNEQPANCSMTIYRGDPNQGKDGRFVLAAYNQPLCDA